MANIGKGKRRQYSNKDRNESRADSPSLEQLALQCQQRYNDDGNKIIDWSTTVQQIDDRLAHLHKALTPDENFRLEFIPENPNAYPRSIEGSVEKSYREL